MLLSPYAPAGAGASARLVLLDTDIGSDIDDAAALSWLLRAPQIELLGITTCTGRPEDRAWLAQTLLDDAGRRVPVLPGAERPLVIPSMQTDVPQRARLAGSAPMFPRGEAIEFLRRTIRERPGEITLLAIGPLTNIALLFRSDPGIPALLRELVWMGGKYSDHPTPWGPTEWNAIVDPHAAHIVLTAPVPAIRAVGLDITWQVFMDPGEVARHFRGDALLRRVLDWSEVWFAERELLHFNDPLAAALLVREDLCTFARGRITVDLTPGDGQGITTFAEDPRGRHRVATSVDAAAFFRTYFDVFEGAGPPAR